ncbi:MAG: DUF488 domain-containing protein [Rhizobiales bacterium]|nr:DUF488 domain-containing protein [Hyphomicrobiales bacterium]
MEIRLKRAYEAPAASDGTRILVDRLWPRGLKKADAAIDHWEKEVAPSDALRRWFGHDPAKWEEFRKRYRAELAGKAEAVADLRQRIGKGQATLVYGARDEAHNQAVVLKELLDERG